MANNDLPLDMQLLLAQRNRKSPSPTPPPSGGGGDSLWLTLVMISVTAMITFTVYKFAPSILHRNNTGKVDVSKPSDNKGDEVKIPGFDPKWGPRKRVEWQWLNSANVVSKQYGNAETAQVVKMLYERGAAATPRPQPEFLELLEASPRNRPDYIGIVPLVGEDAKIDAEWEDGLDLSAFAYCNQIGQKYFIAVRAYQEYDEFAQGAIMIHEGSHIWFRINDLSRPDRGIVEFCQDEQRTQLAELQVWIKRGGQAFKNLALLNMTEYAQKLRENGPAGLIGINVTMKSGDELEDIFGQTTSEDLKHLRTTKLWTYSCLLAIEETYKGAATIEQMKEKYFYEWISRHLAAEEEKHRRRRGR